MKKSHITPLISVTKNPALSKKATGLLLLQLFLHALIGMENSYEYKIKQILSTIFTNQQIGNRLLALLKDNIDNREINKNNDKKNAVIAIQNNISTITKQTEDNNIFSHIIYEKIQNTPLAKSQIIDPITRNHRCQSTSTAIALLYKKMQLQELKPHEKVILASSQIIQHQTEEKSIQNTPLINGIASLNYEKIHQHNIPFINEIANDVLLKIHEKEDKNQSEIIYNLLPQKNKIVLGKSLHSFLHGLQKVVADYGDSYYVQSENIKNIVPFYQTIDTIEKLDGVIHRIVIADKDGEYIRPQSLATYVVNSQGDLESVTTENLKNNPITVAKQPLSASHLIPLNKYYHIIDSIIIPSEKHEKEYCEFIDDINNGFVNNNHIKMLIDMTKRSFYHHSQLIDGLKHHEELSANLVKQYGNNHKNYNEYEEILETTKPINSCHIEIQSNMLKIKKILGRHPELPIASIFHIHVQKGSKDKESEDLQKK
jgi:hypothetical protein